MRKGIDVSDARGIIDWDKVKAAGIDFAIIRGGYGDNIIDGRAERNLSECNRVGIPCGMYWFSYAINEAEARTEAASCIALARKYRLEYPIAYDFEYDSDRNAKKQGVNLTREQRTAIVKTFCEEVEKAGYYAMVYFNQDYLRNYVDENIGKRFGLWYAWYNDTNNREDWQLWQHTSKGYVDGVPGNVDMDYCAIDFPARIREYGCNGFAKPVPKVEAPNPEPQPAPQPVTPLKDYVVQRGDTLSGIAVKHGISLARIKELNPQIENFNLIYAGQTVYVEGTVAATPAPAVPKTPQKGQQISLNNAPLYASASATVAASRKTGTFYLWDGICINGRYRITNAASRVGVSGQVTGFVDKKYV